MAAVDEERIFEEVRKEVEHRGWDFEVILAMARKLTKLGPKKFRFEKSGTERGNHDG